MGYIREKKEEGVDFDNLPKGVYFFTGQEGFVKVEIDKEGNQFWDLQNWYATLDPDKDEAQEKKLLKTSKEGLIQKLE